MSARVLAPWLKRATPQADEKQVEAQPGERERSPDNLSLEQVRGEVTVDIRGTLTVRALRAGSPVQLSGTDTSFLLHERG